MPRYVIGIDFGTLSARAVLMDADTGEELAESTRAYPHAVMDTTLPDGLPLPPNYALQHPKDYLDVLKETFQEVLQASHVSNEAVIGMAIDFTTCTMLPIDENATPLCFYPEYQQNKHAYVKLWKHHAAQPEADDINALAVQRGEEWLSIYGGKISCEWLFPKILEILREAPEIYQSTHRFTEAADWLTLLLTGTETHSAAFAGYKAMWNEHTGYPSNDFFKALDERMDGLIGTKVSNAVYGVDRIAGYVNERGAELCGLKIGTPVAIPMLDAHAALPALGTVADGEAMLIVGTSMCHILNTKQAVNVPGICGYVKDSVIPGLYTYEAGQAGVGDIFDWFVKNCVPAAYEQEANEKGIGIHKLLREKAKRLSPGESGLLALDWWNGNRSILINSKLTGMILGMNLQTKPEEIYRALIEATAFGLKIIIDQYEANGIHTGPIYAAGGIAQKDEMMMQIYADILNKEVWIAGSTQAAAFGSAIYATVAAGVYPDVTVASKKLHKKPRKTYLPIPQNTVAYRTLYEEYKTLHDYFGKENHVMLRIGK